MNNETTCPFCDIGVNSSLFAESDNFRALYNIVPILPGHSLIIPKKHITSVMEFTDSELSELMVFSRNVLTILIKVFKAEAFNWTIQEGAQAGQTISHLHLHLIPRKRNDLSNPGNWYPELLRSESERIESEPRRRLTEDETRDVVLRIKNFIADNSSQLSVTGLF